MGKLSMIIVVGFGIIVGIIGTTMSKRTVGVQKDQMGFYDRVQARNIAKSSSDIYARKIKNDPNLKGTFTFNLLGGSSTVVVSEKTPGNRNRLGMNTQGSFGSAVKTLDLDANKGALMSPPVTGALGVSYLSKAEFQFGMGTNIDGNNHNTAGTLDNSSPAIAGLSLGHPDQQSHLNYKPKDVRIRGKGVVDPNIEIQTPQQDYYYWAMQLAKGADVVYKSKEVKTVATLGTVANPQVTYVKGNTRFNEKITGAGILIVDGNCRINKTIDFVGLLFVVADSLSSEKSNMGSGSSITGAMMVAGKRTSVKTGDVDILYSASAINQALSLVPSHMPQNYVFSNWRE